MIYSSDWGSRKHFPRLRSYFASQHVNIYGISAPPARAQIRVPDFGTPG
jgi:hypothetical protein